MTFDRKVRISEEAYEKLQQAVKSAGGSDVISMAEFLDHLILRGAVKIETIAKTGAENLDPVELDREIKETGLEVLREKVVKLKDEHETNALKKDKLKEEIRKLKIENARKYGKLPPGVMHSLEEEKDTADTGAGFPKWCLNDRVTVESPEELEAHKAAGHSVRELEPGELWEPPSKKGKIWTGPGYS